MFAVVEPYVVAAQLQAEAMKKGLNNHISGAGAGTSVLANACCFQGGGPDVMYFCFSPGQYPVDRVGHAYG